MTIKNLKLSQINIRRHLHRDYVNLDVYYFKKYIKNMSSELNELLFCGGAQSKPGWTPVYSDHFASHQFLNRSA